MRPSRACSFKCETLLVSHEIPHPLDHEPTGGQGRTLGIERRQPACNLVRVDELADAELLRQQHRSRRGFARSIGARMMISFNSIETHHPGQCRRAPEEVLPALAL